jgi:hypothetical protein
MFRFVAMQVRPRLVLLPGAKRASVRVLYEILRLLTGAGQPARNTVDLVAQLQGLFLEADTVTCFLRDPAGLGGCRSALAHPAATLATSSNDQFGGKIPAYADSRNPPRATSFIRASREVRVSS